MMIADNLIEHNDHFRILAAGWELEGKDPRDIRVRVAGRFCRIAYQMVAGGATYRHPSGRGHDYVLRKLMQFGIEHGIELREVMKILEAATGQLPDVAHGEEAEALQGEIDELRKKRGSGVRTLAEILPAVLVKLGVKLIQSEGSGEADRTWPTSGSGAEQRRLSPSWREAVRERGALPDHQRRIRLCGVAPLMYQNGET
jgi:hypothetical protein